MIAITGRADSTLAREADVHLDARVEKEACPLNLAPTASTTATLALGDALAVALLEARGFASDDFAQHHPGRRARAARLLVHVSRHHAQGRAAAAQRAPTTRCCPTALDEMSRKGIGMTCVVDADDRLLGIFTDGDLRRTLEKRDGIEGPHRGRRDDDEAHAHRARHASPPRRRRSSSSRASAGASWCVAPDGKLVGAVTFHDLLAAGVV